MDWISNISFSFDITTLLLVAVAAGTFIWNTRKKIGEERERERLIALMDIYDEYRPKVIDLLEAFGGGSDEDLNEKIDDMAYFLRHKALPRLAVYGEPEDMQAVKDILEKIRTFHADMQAAIKGAPADKMNAAGDEVVHAFTHAMVEFDVAFIGRLRQVAQEKDDVQKVLDLYESTVYRKV